ncbi:MAG TPA: hypothetical protein DEV98_04145 [Clostridiales bacterium]|nr:hypothetical protein [Clostridiales bacterium]
MNNEHKYDDIINLPHHVSQRHPQLGCDSYAAQFSPFAALTGYDGVVAEVARTTDQRIELDEDAKARIDLQLQILIDHIDEEPTITATYFVPDPRKSGGAYVTTEGKVDMIDEFERVIVLQDKTRIPVYDVYEIKSEFVARFMPDD